MRPDDVLSAAAKVGGIHANRTRQGEFLYDNLSEAYLLTGPLEPTNEGYAIAKIAALELTKMYRRQYDMRAISLTPTNLYGPDDDFDLQTSHVLPALLRKTHEAKASGQDKVVIWGTGETARPAPASQTHVGSATTEIADRTWSAADRYLSDGRS